MKPDEKSAEIIPIRPEPPAPPELGPSREDRLFDIFIIGMCLAIGLILYVAASLYRP